MLKEKMRWTFFGDMLKDEYRQCIDEGREVEAFSAEIEEILGIEEEKKRNMRARELLVKMEQSPVRRTFPYYEPETYEGIAASLPPQAETCYPYQQNRLEDQIRGAWYGRTAGCVLGIPVEGWPRKKIFDYLKASGQFPLKKYIASAGEQQIRQQFDITEEDITTPYDRTKICWLNCLDGKIPNDDDLNYTAAALKLLERYGQDFTSEDVAETWLLGIPPLHTCTAERAAVRNLMNGVLPPASAIVCNPYREWIGAQIRGDFFGYINPGNPHRASKMAYLDAAVSHTKNGVYGEMFIAALISLCFVETFSMKERIRLAMMQIPPGSRLKESLDEVCGWYESGKNYEQAVEEIHSRYNENEQFDWCLTIPNAMIVTACLLWKENFSESISAAVLAGFDTDCNGATVGSVKGAAGGFQKIDPKWYAPFEGNLYTSVHGYHKLSFEEAVQRTLTLIV